MVKSSTTVSVTAAGQVVPYSFTVTNTGNATLTGITVSAPRCGAAPMLDEPATATPTAKLQLGETWLYGCSHTVTQAELDAGGNLSNTVTADSVESAAGDQHARHPVTQTPVHPRGQVVDDGDCARCWARSCPTDFTVTNTGNVTLTGITVSDPKCGAAPALSSGRHERRLEAAARRDVGVRLLAHRHAGGGRRGREPLEHRHRRLGRVAAGHEHPEHPCHGQSSDSRRQILHDGLRHGSRALLPYSFTVTNTGNVTLTGITVSDPKCAAAPVLSAGDGNADAKLQLAETWLYACSHTVTQAEVDAGGNLSNTVTADSVESAAATSTLNIPVAQSPSIHVVKSSTTVSVTAAGQVVPYTFTVTNTGNVTLTAISVSDPKCDAAPAFTGGDTNADSKLQLAETWAYACNRTVTQAEVDAGGNLSNTVTVDSAESAPATSSLNIPVAQSPSIHVVKSSTTATVIAAGQVVPYTFTVTNTGNITLTGITVLTQVRRPAHPLERRHERRLEAAARRDLGLRVLPHGDAGGGRRRREPLEHGHRRLGRVAAGHEHAEHPGHAVPSIHVVKSSTTVSATAAGQVVPYTFTLTNTGNVTLTGITLSIRSAPLPPALSAGDGNGYGRLQLAETWLYGLLAHRHPGGDRRGREPVEHGDGRLGRVGTGRRARSTSPWLRRPAIHVVKSSTTAAVTAPGQAVPTPSRSRHGNLTLSARSPACPTRSVTRRRRCQAGDTNADSKLQLAETWVYGCTHTVTVAELDAGGNLSNTVTVDSAESAPATSTLNIPVTQSPAIDLVKVAVLDEHPRRAAGTADAGDQIDYTLTATNTGNVSLTGVDDHRPDARRTGLRAGPARALAPGAALTCTASHTITVGDVTTGHVDNTAHDLRHRPERHHGQRHGERHRALSPAPSLAIVKSRTPDDLRPRRPGDRLQLPGDERRQHDGCSARSR